MSTPPLLSRLPAAPENIFQRIKKIRTSAEARGIKIYGLGVGQPSGPALESARHAASQAALSTAEAMHEYQDNGSPGVLNFSQRFVQHHVKKDLSTVPNLGYLPIPGLKPMLGIIPIACGASRSRFITVLTTTDPGYPTPAYWAKITQGVAHHSIRLSPENGFLFHLSDLWPYELGPDTLIMMNYPHNPSGKAATREWLEQLCSYAAKNGIRLFNDAAYAVLAHNGEHTTLADVAADFPDLSWAEGFSASKAIGNGTGWRVGAIVGSSDFVSDIARIKGDTDSGFVAFAAAGVIHAFDTDKASIEANRRVFAERLEILIGLGEQYDLRLAVKPDAGFFTLWQVPKKAFGVEVTNAEHFNTLMIENTGILGVPFNPYIRYSVTGHIHQMRPAIEEGFKKAEVSY